MRSSDVENSAPRSTEPNLTFAATGTTAEVDVSEPERSAMITRGILTPWCGCGSGGTVCGVLEVDAELTVGDALDVGEEDADAPVPPEADCEVLVVSVVVPSSVVAPGCNRASVAASDAIVAARLSKVVPSTVACTLTEAAGVVVLDGVADVGAGAVFAGAGFVCPLPFEGDAGVAP